jgi:hypothetical protein
LIQQDETMTNDRNQILRIAKQIGGVHATVVGITPKCKRVVLEINNALERFEVDKRQPSVKLVDLRKKLGIQEIEISKIEITLLSLESKFDQYEHGLHEVVIEYSDTDAMLLKSSVSDAILEGRTMVDNFRSKLGSVSDQMQLAIADAELEAG